jgi:hypothetical protein
MVLAKSVKITQDQTKKGYFAFKTIVLRPQFLILMELAKNVLITQDQTVKVNLALLILVLLLKLRQFLELALHVMTTQGQMLRQLNAFKTDAPLTRSFD